MRLTPHVARIYLLLAAFLLALPALSQMYRGHTGRLLVAAVHVAPPFKQSVIYIVRHNLFGATGFIVNMPRDEGAYYGGPVAVSTSSVIGVDATGAIRFASVYEGELTGLRTIHGYAGWGVIQLDYEFLRNNWDAIDYDQALVFETPPEDIWPEARRRVLKGIGAIDKKIL